MALQTVNRKDMLVEAAGKMSPFGSFKPEHMMSAGLLAFESLGSLAGANDKVIICAPLSTYQHRQLLQALALALSYAQVNVQIIQMDADCVASPIQHAMSLGDKKITVSQDTAEVAPSLVVHLGKGITQLMANFNKETSFITTAQEAKAAGATIISQSGSIVLGKLLAARAEPGTIGSDTKLPIAKWSRQAKGKLYVFGNGTIARMDAAFGIGGDVYMTRLEMDSTGTTVDYFPSAVPVQINLADERKYGGGWLDDALTMRFKLTGKMKSVFKELPDYIEAARRPASWVPKKMSEEERKALKRKMGGTHCF